MLYRELVNFEPIESVKQLRQADSVDQAKEDVRTYVISPKMREQLVSVVLPNLRFDNPEHDHKGLLLVATYGTGKTHLMSCLAGVAENAQLALELTDSATAAAAASVAGKFKVVRVEIGAVQMGLRDILAAELTRGLAAMGVSYEFPALDQVTNNKDPLQKMMLAFEEQYPDQGLLLVVDELLDYLRTRKDSEIILDLGFLREMGEFCQNGRFRLIAGVQETIFDNPRFALAQDEVRRVRERFQSFRIAREDVAYVVQQRILRKDAGQKQLIREHLARFAPAFESIGANLDNFVEMFPIHPAYLQTFEVLTMVEKRRVLSSLTDQIRHRLNTEVPSDEPGVISFDSYRAELEEDPANKVIPDVSAVLQRARVLRDRVERGMEAPDDVRPAIRIVDALSVHRLTTDDIEASIGMTVEELRDDLCLLPPGTPELDSSFIANSIESLVQEIGKAVSGQFITVNEVNGQIYLDLKKDVDYEQQVSDRAETLDLDAMDNAYYKALEQLMEVTTSSYVAGYRIWSYELPWAAKRVTRQGYLFMGAPNERSTAEPPRDFYIYFLQPYSRPVFEDSLRPDDVFLALDVSDGGFTNSLRRYAAALAKAGETTSQHRSAFEGYAKKHLSEMVTWLKANLARHMVVTYQGQAKTIAQWLADVPGPRKSLKEQLDAIASTVLTPHFATRYPGYPVFDSEMTSSNLMASVQSALGMFNGKDTALGRSLLRSLALCDSDGQIALDGPFAQALLDTLTKSGGHAVNHDEIFNERERGVRTWGPWHLEPLWMVVVAAALTYFGKAEIGFAGGQRVGAQNLDALTRLSREHLERPSFVTTPAGADAAVLTRVATLLGLPPALGQNTLTSDSTASFVANAENAHLKVGELKSYVLSAPRLWGEELFDDPTGRLDRIDAYLSILADVRTRNTVGKLARLSHDASALDAAEAGKQEAGRIAEFRTLAERLTTLVRQLEDAGNVLADANPLRERAESLRTKLREILRAPSLDQTAASVLRREAETLKGEYRSFAVERHAAERLTSAAEAKKLALIASGTWTDLQALSGLELLPSGQFGDLEAKLNGLVACKQFTPDVFDTAYVCPHCNYRPRPATGPTAQARLEDVSERAEELWQEWTDTLRDAVSADEISSQLELIDAEGQEAVAVLIEGGLARGSVTQTLISATRQLLKKFRVVPVTAAQLMAAVFPSPRAIAPREASEAFEEWLKGASLLAGGDSSSVRLIAQEEAR